MSITERYGFPAGYREKSLAALTAALGTAPLYRSWRKFDPGPGAALDARYDALPELTKNEMRRHFPQGLVPNRLNVEEGLARDEIEYTFTSGSTGEKVVNLFNQKCGPPRKRLVEAERAYRRSDLSPEAGQAGKLT
jgi:hypothetical protein